MDTSDRPGPGEHWIVRPGQLRLDELRAGIVAMDSEAAILQVHVGQELPIRRITLAVADTATVDGWALTLRQIDPAGRGSVLVKVVPPIGA